MSETNLLHYIQSWDFVDQIIDVKVYDKIYADVWHLFPNCIPLSQFDMDNDQSTLVILSRFTVAEFLQMYDINNLTKITVINMRVWVASIGHKLVSEFDDIWLMTWYGRRVYEPISLSDLDNSVITADCPTYIRITHRYVPSQMDMKQRNGLWYFGEMWQSMTLFPASMIETIGLLDPEEQKSQYMLVSDWTNWYLSDEFREIASYGWFVVVVMEQSQQSAWDYCEMISSLYPKLRIIPIVVGSILNSKWDVIVDEYRDERYGCDDIAIAHKLKSISTQ